MRQIGEAGQRPGSARRAGRRRGFTFLEVLIALLIVGVLSGVVGLSLYGHYRKAKVEAARLQIRTFKQALQLYRADHGRFPTEQQGLEALCARPTSPPVPEHYPEEGYLDTRVLPRDPWGAPYVYMAPGSDGAPFEIVSYGSDARPGGTDDAADLSSLSL